MPTQTRTATETVSENPSTTSAARVVDELVIHDSLIDFKALCDQVVTDKTKYLVLDLDRTIHFGHNVGELLGWELCALDGYGPGYFDMLKTRTDRGRFYIAWNRPFAALKYLLFGIAQWAIPGLIYLFGVKLGAKLALTRRWIYRLCGIDPVDVVQNIPRLTLLHQISAVPLETARALTRELWRRLEPDQVITREDLQYLRERYPKLRIIISSASPQPVLEVAREQLGVDDIVYTEVEEHEGYLSAPFHVKRLGRRPRRISPPSRTKQNASERKVETLQARYPDFCDPAVETVGVTDTSHGEDHSWALHFTKLVDINSPTPFAPIVPSRSPLRAIYSAQVRTRSERERGIEGSRSPDHSKALLHPGVRRFLKGDLTFHLEGFVRSMEDLIGAYQRQYAALEEARHEARAKLNQLYSQMEQSVNDYNHSIGKRRDEALALLRRYLRENAALQKRTLKLERPLAKLACSISHILRTSRASLR